MSTRAIGRSLVPTWEHELVRLCRPRLFHSLFAHEEAIRSLLQLSCTHLHVLQWQSRQAVGDRRAGIAAASGDAPTADAHGPFRVAIILYQAGKSTRACSHIGTAEFGTGTYGWSVFIHRNDCPMHESLATRLTKALAQAWAGILRRHPDVPAAFLIPSHKRLRQAFRLTGHFFALECQPRQRQTPGFNRGRRRRGSCRLRCCSNMHYCR
jgi:hypothetical protein